MSRHRLTRRMRRVALASAGLSLAAITAAPVASATSSASQGYEHVAPSGPTTEVLGVKYGPEKAAAQTSSTTETRVLGTKYSGDTLAYTGAEIGGVAGAGLVFVIGGALLVRSGRRRPNGSF